MKLIDSIELDGYRIKFYNGIDFDIVKKHPTDGSSGMIICYIKNWINEVKLYNRINKLNSIIYNKDFSELNWVEDINNNHISIYQSDGVGVKELHKVIKEKLIKGITTNNNWIPISGIKKGAWKINTDIDN
jgi:hypothetical protein